MIRDFFSGKRDDVANDFVILFEVGAIRFLRPLVPLTGENTSSAGGLEPKADSTNSGKQINKCKWLRVRQPDSILQDIEGCQEVKGG